MTIHDFIKKRKYLIWYTENYDNLPPESIVEATLNYGDWNDVKTLIKILGIKKVAKIFFTQTDPRRMRINYFPEVRHYFSLYFKKYA